MYGLEDYVDADRIVIHGNQLNAARDLYHLTGGVTHIHVTTFLNQANITKIYNGKLHVLLLLAYFTSFHKWA